MSKKLQEARARLEDVAKLKLQVIEICNAYGLLCDAFEELEERINKLEKRLADTITYR